MRTGGRAKVKVQPYYYGTGQGTRQGTRDETRDKGRGTGQKAKKLDGKF